MIVTKFGMSDSLKMYAFPDFDFENGKIDILITGSAPSVNQFATAFPA